MVRPLAMCIDDPELLCDGGSRGSDMSENLIKLQKQGGAHGGASHRGSHRLSSVYQCEMKYALDYVYKFKTSNEPEHRVMGTLVHTLLAYHYAMKMAEDVRPIWLSTPIAEALAKDARGNLELIEKARNIYEGYRAYWSNDPWEPIFVEKEFAATVGELDPGGALRGTRLPIDDILDKEVVTARTDLVIQTNGNWWVVDHKTASAGWNSERLARWSDDNEYNIAPWQFMVYLWIVRTAMKRDLGQEYADKIKGVTVNRVKRNLPYDYDRNTVRIWPARYKRTPKTIRAMVARERYIDEIIRLGLEPASNFAACMTRWGACDHLAYCNSEDREAAREANYI